ncbi:hypothetical protein LB467_01025 [Salegentibacter sp. JZCK2]|uniref:hypothetical protein n=1 Tax=Salegentibacter tibetensis TaxID=2873600 RepID=UPI001CC9A647|nr:hypothetical protein [Salegentibacter tibetensis]MBZ9728257.1 hypothetical protein [Salegentibacter tibetensis]
MNYLKLRILVLIGLSLTLLSCASIPKEAPMLSQNLGIEIQELESSHYQLVEVYFDLKRKNAREYLEKVWLPKYAGKFFSDPDIKEMWEMVISSGSEKDRLMFLLVTAPELQSEINKQYQYMIGPLDQLEKMLKGSLTEKYNNARSINNVLTSFLVSAAEVEQNRQRYLDMAGITDEKISSAIHNIEVATSKMVSTATKANAGFSDVESNISQYREKINQILNQVK